MLLHNTNINVAIAHILVYRKRLYELPKRIWNFHDFAKRAWPKNPTWQGPSVLRFFLVFIGTNTNHIHQKLACSKPFPGTAIFFHKMTGLYTNHCDIAITPILLS